MRTLADETLVFLGTPGSCTARGIYHKLYPCVLQCIGKVLLLYSQLLLVILSIV